jgi:hypothetical protein
MQKPIFMVAGTTLNGTERDDILLVVRPTIHCTAVKAMMYSLVVQVRIRYMVAMVMIVWKVDRQRYTVWRCRE